MDNKMDWKAQRQNIKDMFDRYPGSIMDCVGSAYLAGLEVADEIIKADRAKTIEMMESKEVYYCTSGCGCEYPQGSSAHEYDCVWKLDETHPVNEVISDMRKLLEGK